MTVINESGGAFLRDIASNAPVWAASTSYAIAQRRKPTVDNGCWYIANDAGISDTFEPTWPTTNGQTVVDNPGTDQITWQCVEPWTPEDYADIQVAATGTVASSSYVEVGQLFYLQVSGERVYQVYRDALFFDVSGLSAIPVSAKITALVEDKYADADYDIVIVDGSPVEDTPEAADYGDLLAQTTSLGSVNIADTTIGVRVEFTLSAEGLRMLYTPTWAVATTYAALAHVQPTTPNGYWYKTTLGGTSHATTEPTWPTTIGNTVSDGTVTWTCIGKFTPGTAKFGLRSSRDISATDPKQNGGDWYEYIDFSAVKLELPGGARSYGYIVG